MSDLLTQIKVYDVECYPNMFMVTLYSFSHEKYLTFTIYPDTNIDDREKIIRAFLRKDVIWCGYNNLSYDDAMINRLILLCCKKEQVDTAFILNNKLQWDKDNNFFKIDEIWYEVNFTRLDETVTTKDLTRKLYNYSQTLLTNNRGKYEKKCLAKSLDLMEVIKGNSKQDLKSLKAIGVNLKHHKLQELPIEFNKSLTPDQLDLMKSYNRNDVVITCKLLDATMPLVEMRQSLTEHYDNKVDLLTESRTSICKKVLGYYYREKLRERNTPRYSSEWQFHKKRTERGEIKFTEILNEKIYFETTVLQSWLDDIKTHIIPKPKENETHSWSSSITFDNVTYNIGVGGIHSVDKDAVYKSDDTYQVLDLDVTSFYPFSMINYELCPEHLDKTILFDILGEIVNERVKYKKHYQEHNDPQSKNLQEVLKIVINSFFGLTNDKYSWLYDPHACYKCTVNNQLFMLMLIESFVLNGWQVLSANTDGVTIYCKKQELPQVREVYKHWEEYTLFQLEETFYSIYLRRDINNYIAVKNDGKLKFKGLFTPQEEKELLQAFKYPIKAKALVNYFLHDIPIEKTIYECRDIYDFCYSEKCGKQYTNYLQKVRHKERVRYGKGLCKLYVEPKIERELIEEQVIQRTLRVFVSLPEIYKSDEEDLLDGYNDEYKIGYTIVKKKPVTKNRYEVEKDPELKKCWWIIDLETGEKAVETPYVFKNVAEPIAKEMSQTEEGKLHSVQTQEYIAGKFVTLFNDYFSVDNFADYKIDYDFYIDLVQKEVDKIEKNNG